MIKRSTTSSSPHTLSLALLFGLAACGGSGVADDHAGAPLPELDASNAGDGTPYIAQPDAGACSHAGCACDDGSEPVSCYPEPILAADGTKICAQGTQYCRQGKWSSCESLVTFGLVSQASTAVDDGNDQITFSGLHKNTSALVVKGTCDQCHPNCFNQTDTPVATDVVTNSTQVTYDPVQAGIRLAISENTGQRGDANSKAVCGNKKVEGVEQCDDSNTKGGDGCDPFCLLEAGYFCPIEGKPCQLSQCGNGTQEGLEQCDDGNSLIGDGCTFWCTREPTCDFGQPCTPVCGDGQELGGEQCDDGNTRDGDGCSSTCKLEKNSGWYCVDDPKALPDSIDLPTVIRDFVGKGLATASGASNMHIDFENLNGALSGMVQTSWDSDKTSSTYKKPLYANPQPASTKINSATTFAQWYTDVPLVNKSYTGTLTVKRDPTTGVYSFYSASYYPLDSKSDNWIAQGKENWGKDASGVKHDYSFTSEVRFWFVYNSSTVPKLDFKGDDDVWVFINGKLALDLGGIHGESTGTVTLDAAAATKYGLANGKLYEAAVFQAERHQSGSNYKLSLSGFAGSKTTCTSKCGDGYVTSDEFCDDGNNNGQVGYCLPDCTGRAPVYFPSASYWRDYTAIGSCNIPPERPLWGNLNWTTTATSGGSITFQLQGSDTNDFTNATKVLVPIVVTAGTGSFNVHDALQAAGVASDPLYLRVTALLASSLDMRQTPVLKSFAVAMQCVNAE